MGRREAGREELLERICNDQVRRWRRGQRVPAETYLSMYPRLRDDDEAAFELIYGEYLLREELGETPSPRGAEVAVPAVRRAAPRQVDLHEVLSAADDADARDRPDGRPPASPTRGPSPTARSSPRVSASWGAGPRRHGGGLQGLASPSLKRIVAVKVLRADAYADAGAAARFQAEAEAAARFQHPNIVQVYEVGEHDGMGYLVLEYAAGGGLDRRLAETLQDPRETPPA